MSIKIKKVLDNKPDETRNPVKLILLGDSAVGKSKLVERFLMQRYVPVQMSTYALTLFHYDFIDENDEQVDVDIWDTAGQERFSTMHPAYYHNAHACILVFDITRKATYKNLEKWLGELRNYREHIPCIVAANKIDTDPSVMSKAFAFVDKHNLPLHYVSAADGTNVVQLFEASIGTAVNYRKNPKNEDFITHVLGFIKEGEKKEGEKKEEAATAAP
ncbi:putative rab11B GTPase [Trypanosoma theileri]|uniref:Putative rab11B GTPase n=1 Tax=Trypanosoma theileri TaxID=67003 RepID=A0A1X0NUA8_9TRYP|nr:putative rab11B GTPase [Trypanosoma theileri]ORC88294.1 putative rab11B GTPase [Trypanosoma theileri]